ncbi:protein GLUTAMINE DUMPER 2 [Ricinus communis]|uniref:Uncharacterized protein n=1 Tax=Ricinus communis TaxID=3988 RepID=B9TNZ9_RICCO|nr:protein GLUTAMINE DUMPER 2 [Ricinus communis]EEF22415.1 conserved hypothetical protein [Ricinus communis]|eukprot:XP_002539968.1 protein GLUTAMINE DUMPER 2 [Ricinus communis]
MSHGSNSGTASAPSVNGGFQHWNSPVPYLFGGLALMLGLIAMALMILACSYKNSSPSNNSSPRDHQAAEEKSRHDHKRAELQMEMEPKIVVIMAGDHNPTYFAKPAVPLHLPKYEQQV